MPYCLTMNKLKIIQQLCLKWLFSSNYSADSSVSSSAVSSESSAAVSSSVASSASSDSVSSVVSTSCPGASGTLMSPAIILSEYSLTAAKTSSDN